MAPTKTPHDTAVDYLLAHQAEHLSHDRAHLLGRCAEHIAQTYPGTSDDAATTTAMQAFGDLASRGNHAYLDLTKTTAHVAFVVDPSNGYRTVFTAADLLHIARGRKADAGAATH